MNNVLFEIAFEYEGKLYHEVVDGSQIDLTHYEHRYDYWFGDIDGIHFELNGDKDNAPTAENLCVCVYLFLDSVNPDSILTDLWVKKPGENCFSPVALQLK